MDAPPLAPLAAAVLHVPAPERALVIGCGAAEPALFLAREFPAARIRGVALSAAEVRAAIAKVGLDPEGRVAFKVGRPRHLPYPDEFFDLVVQSTGRPVPRELVRVLRPAGHLILVRPRFLRFARSREKLSAMSLTRHGFGAPRDQRAGDGRFQVMQLDPGNRGVSR